MGIDSECRKTLTLQSPTRSAVGTRSVLVVDDEPAVGRALARVLKSKGYHVKTVGDGIAAVSAIRHEPFDVILSDIQMPGRTGVDLLRVVRAYNLDVPVILMTGMPSMETAKEALSLGAFQYIAKPIPDDVLLSAVERASLLHRMASMKREALALAGKGDIQIGDRAGLKVRFDHALETMRIAFQPIVDPEKGRVFGYEALMRASEPSLPHPGAMLVAAERLGRVHDLGRRVRSLTAMAFVRAPPDVLLFLNLHTHDLLDETPTREGRPPGRPRPPRRPRDQRAGGRRRHQGRQGAGRRPALRRFPPRYRRSGRRLRRALELRIAGAGVRQVGHIARAGRQQIRTPSLAHHIAGRSLPGDGNASDRQGSRNRRGARLRPQVRVQSAAGLSVRETRTAVSHGHIPGRCLMTAVRAAPSMDALVRRALGRRRFPRCGERLALRSRHFDSLGVPKLTV